MRFIGNRRANFARVRRLRDYHGRSHFMTEGAVFGCRGRRFGLAIPLRGSSFAAAGWCNRRDYG